MTLSNCKDLHVDIMSNKHSNLSLFAFSQVRVTATVNALNQLSLPDGPDYVITSRALLQSSYEEGKFGTPCVQSEYNNPYKSYCNNMTNICPISIGMYYKKRVQL